MKIVDCETDCVTNVCDFLIKNMANINIQDKYGQTPLHYAAMRGNEIVAKELLALPFINVEVSHLLSVLYLNQLVHLFIISII